MQPTTEVAIEVVYETSKHQILNFMDDLSNFKQGIRQLLESGGWDLARPALQSAISYAPTSDVFSATDISDIFDYLESSSCEHFWTSVICAKIMPDRFPYLTRRWIFYDGAKKSGLMCHWRNGVYIFDEFSHEAYVV